MINVGSELITEHLVAWSSNTRVSLRIIARPINRLQLLLKLLLKFILRRYPDYTRIRNRQFSGSRELFPIRFQWIYRSVFVGGLIDYPLGTTTNPSRAHWRLV